MAIELTTAATGQISGIKASLFLDNVDNTSDLDKPVSTAQQAYITGISGDLQTTIDGLDASHHVTYNGATGDVNLGVHKIVATTGEFTNLDISSNIVVGGTVDGRDVAADGSVIDGLGTISTFNSGDYLNTARTATYTPTADYHPSTKKYVDDHAAVSATTTTKGHVELATNTEAHAATDTTRAVTPSNLLIKKDGTAIVAGDLTGNSRGSNALDVQSGRNNATQVASGSGSSAVGYDNRAFGNNSSAFGYYNNASANRSSAFGDSNTASGSYSSAVGRSNTASGYNSSAVGYNNTVSGNYGCAAFGYQNTVSGPANYAVGRNNTASASYGLSSAFGYDNTASGFGSSAFGYNNTASGSNSSAVGYQSAASGNYSSAVGYRAKTTVNNTFEAGYWSGTTTRGGAIRMHPNGQVAMTIEDSASAPTDGGATAGSEADGTLARGMFAIQKNGTAVTLYYNNGGTIQSLSLGTLS